MTQQHRLGWAGGGAGLACLAGLLFLACVMSNLLFTWPGIVPIRVPSVPALYAWVLISLLLVATAPFGLRKRFSIFLLVGRCLRFLLGLGGIVAFLLITELGIFLGGHKYWIGRAFEGPTVNEAEMYLDVVLRSTQYGKDVAATAIEGASRRARGSAS